MPVFRPSAAPPPRAPLLLLLLPLALPASLLQPSL